MPIHPRAAGILISASLISGTAAIIASAQESRPAAGQSQDGAGRNDGRPRASPTSSVDLPSRDIAPLHRRPLVRRDGRTLHWAAGDPRGGPGATWFDMTDALVDPAKFQFGIGKDRIPSIDAPTFARLGDPKLAAARIGDQTDVIGFVMACSAPSVACALMDERDHGATGPQLASRLSRSLTPTV